MGRQFANDVATPAPVEISRDKFKNEICNDTKDMEHNNSTPEMGSFNWDAGHYADGWEGGNKQYGVNVEAPKGTTMYVKGDVANRGPEN